MPLAFPFFNLPRRSYTCFAVMFLNLNLALGLLIDCVGDISASGIYLERFEPTVEKYLFSFSVITEGSVISAPSMMSF